LIPLDPALVAELLALGVGVGLLAGLLGVGGGMLLVPVLTLVLSRRGVEAGLSVKMAVATSMATIVFTSLSSVRAHHRLNAVRWDIVRAMAPGIVVGGLLAGAGVFAVLHGRWLGILFVMFIGLTAIQMLRNRQPSPGRSLPSPLIQAVMGTAIGLISALVGAGGAFLSVPFMSWCNVPLRSAVGTSAALGFPIAAASTVGYLFSGRGLAPALPGALGYLYLPALGIVALASVSLAPLGARLAQHVDVAVLKRLFALLLLGLAATMLAKALG
jgi:uncharacterized membrane protein YfcA